MPNNDGYNIRGIVKMLFAVIAVVSVVTAFFFDMSKCSIVMDKTSQSGILVSEYCPKMEHCAEGAHVMCMYYNPNKIYGARCYNVQNVSMTQELANQLLDVSNGIRSKIALGKERGKGGNYLPRGYGVFRLEWDTELATFAQVLANQCVLRHDLCRATKKFADPGQTAGLVRFTYPDWFPVSKNGHFKTPGLNDEKLLYSTTQTLKSWYGQKESVNADMILRYPDWIQHPDDQGGRLYLEMIYGPATHMGCGVTAYTEYAYQDNNAALNYNSVQVVCNYSARPRKGAPVYNTDPPDGMNLSPRCGCPMDSVEDTECLCKHASRITPTVTPPKYLRTCEKGVNCDPTVVLLPIFTVEDAPPQKLAARQRFSNITLPGDRSLDVFNVFETPENKLLFPLQTNGYNTQDGGLGSKRTSLGTKKIVTDVKNRYFNANPRFSIKQYHDKRNRKGDYGYEKKDGISRNPHRKSLFARTSLFELPQSKKYKNNDPISQAIKGKVGFLRKNTYIRDVKPRKDFSSVQRLVKSYMNEKRGRKEYSSDVFVEKKTLFNALNHPDKKESHNNLETEYDINNAKNHRNSESTFSTRKFRFNDFNLTSGETYRNVDIQTSNDENDKNLMVLLNNLEQEVKHIELNTNEKEIFDEKIRKIYDKVVRKPVDTTKNYYDERIKHNINSEKEDHTSDGYKTEINNNKKTSDDINFYDTEKKALEINQNLYGKYSDVEIRRRPVYNGIRTPNTLFNNDKVNKDGYHKPKSIRDVVNSWKTKNNQENSDKEFTFSDTDKIGDDSIKGIRNTHYSDSENHVETLYRKLNNPKPKEERTSDTDMDANRHERRRQHSIDDDVLSVDRRKFYQEKLENIEKKLRNTRSYKRRSNLESDRQLRPVRPNKDLQIRPSKTKTQIDPFYVPDRARFLHGF